MAAAIVGVRNSLHVKDNRQIFSFELTGDETEAIRAFLADYPDLEGEPFQLERTVGSKYRNIMHMNINEEEN